MRINVCSEDIRDIERVTILVIQLLQIDRGLRLRNVLPH